MIKLIGFGASTMQGVGDLQGGFFKRLEPKLAAAGAPRECINFGIGGHSTRDMLVRMTDVRPHLPSAGIVILGCNDLPRERDAHPQNRLSVEDYATNLTTILKELYHPDSIFVSSFRVHPEKTGVQPGTFAEYMGVALKVAAAQGFTIWDLYAESASFGDKYYAPDGMHYSDTGHEFIAERLCKMIAGS